MKLEEALKKSDEYHAVEINKLREVIEILRAENARYRKALEFYASGKMFSSDPYCSVWEGWEYKNYDKRPIEAGQKAREALKGE